ncbi:MAG: hypothetical protein ACFFCH_09025, partial [Promethearchaeota archaeon]
MAPMFPAKMSNLTAIVLDTEMDAALRLIASTGFVHFADVKESQKKHLKSLIPVEPSERFYYLSNLLTRITQLISDMNVYRGGKVKTLLEVPAIPDETYFEKIEKTLKALEDNYTDLAQQLSTAEAKEDKKTAKTLKKEIAAIADKQRFTILGWEELVSREHKIEETKTLFGKTKRTYVMYGWIPTKKVKKFTKTVEEQKTLNIALTIHKHTDKPEHGHYPADYGPLEGEVEPE